MDSKLTETLPTFHPVLKRGKGGTMGWVLKKAGKKNTSALTDEEMDAVELLLRCRMGEPQDQTNVLFRAWQKIIAATTEVRNGSV
jgi:hypothetical protein